MTCAALILGMHLATYHFDRSKPTNPVNIGAYVSCDDWLGGAYYNSQWHTSLYAARVWHMGVVDIATGAVSGYGGTWVRPMLIPSVRVGNHVRLSWLPPSRLSGEGGLHVSWEMTL